jgi:hypothetical protein
MINKDWILRQGTSLSRRNGEQAVVYTTSDSWSLNYTIFIWKSQGGLMFRWECRPDISRSMRYIHSPVSYAGGRGRL